MKIEIPINEEKNFPSILNISNNDSLQALQEKPKSLLNLVNNKTKSKDEIFPITKKISFLGASSYDENDSQSHSKRARMLFKKEKIIDDDSENEPSETEKETPCLILPDNYYKNIFDLVIDFIIIYSSVVLSYQIAFIDLHETELYNTVIDVLLFIDIVLTFFTAYNDKNNKLVKCHKKITIKYIKSWFIVDFISVFPIHLFFKGNLSKLSHINRVTKVYRIIKLVKLLRIAKLQNRGGIGKIQQRFVEKLNINANIVSLFSFVLIFILLNHLFACFWCLVAKLEDMSQDCWVVRLGYLDSSNIDLYIISFYWTLTTVSTVGYGDVTAGTTIERVFTMFIMSFGVIFYSFAIGFLSPILDNMNKQNKEMNEKLEVLKIIKKEFDLSEETFEKVRKVIKLESTKNQNYKQKFLMNLPNKLRIELNQIMYDIDLQNLNFFHDQPTDFFACVGPLLKPVKFSKDDYLYKYLDIIEESNFIYIISIYMYNYVIV